MKIQAVCEECHREFLLSQLQPEPEGTEGRCPSCGHRFARHYVAALPEVIDETDQAAQSLKNNLEKLRGMNPGFKVDTDAVFRAISAGLDG